MYQLNFGDIRYIQDSLTPWKMYIHPIEDAINELPAEVSERLRTIEDSYINEFKAFYQEAKSADESKLADDIRYEFDDVWREKQPEFYDFSKLFEGCSEDDLNRVGYAIEDATKAFAKQEL